jgi:hypothetical protein
MTAKAAPHSGSFSRSAAEATDDGAREAAFRRLRLSAEAATALGALVVLLTAAAQAAS